MVNNGRTSPAVTAAATRSSRVSFGEEEQVVAVGNNKAFLEMLANQNKQILSALASQNELLGKIQQRKAASGRDGSPEDDDINDIIDVLSKSTTAAEVKDAEPPKPKAPTTFGPWGFAGSPLAFKLRQRVVKTLNPEAVFDMSIEPLTDRELADCKDALFGMICGEEQIEGDSFGKNWKRMRNLDAHGKPVAPKWSADGEPSVRSLLPRIQLGGKEGIKLNTGIYYLTVQYNNEQDMWGVESAIIIGEISFDNRGNVLAYGADFDKILKGKYAGDEPDKWFSSKISSAPWTDGDRLRFKIDTNENSISYHNVSSGEKAIFPNVLTYTNKGESLEVFAYCGAKFMKEFPSSSADSNRLSLINSKKAW